MAGEQCERHIELAEDGKIRAAAEVTPMDQSVIRASLHADAGHLPVGTRTRLVDAVLDLPETAGHDRLEATVPLGDAESIARLRERCDKVATRPAGFPLRSKGRKRTSRRPGRSRNSVTIH